MSETVCGISTASGSSGRHSARRLYQVHETYRAGEGTSVWSWSGPGGCAVGEKLTLATGIGLTGGHRQGPGRTQKGHDLGSPCPVSRELKLHLPLYREWLDPYEEESGSGFSLEMESGSGPEARSVTGKEI